MDDFYNEIQSYLLKKDHECGQLRFLTSRTTIENINDIEDVCKSISTICKKCGIPSECEDIKEDKACVQAFKYLLLNTCFKAQEHLIEDVTSGHLTDMCPPLSPYLFLEIVKHLQYEGILTEFIFYVPLDLCVEILESTQKCFECLDFERGFYTVITLISNAYKKFLAIKDSGTQTSNFVNFMDRFVNAIKELILLLLSNRLNKLDEVSDLKKDKRHGIIVQNILKMVRNCLESDKVIFSEEREKIFRITFGNQSPVEGDANVMKQYLEEIDRELLNLLLKKIKEIDCNIYLGWAELDVENNSMSLQRSIGIDFFNFVEDFKNDERLTENGHLIQCLNQISSKPDKKRTLSEMSLQELCDKGEGKKDYIKELMKRHKEWTESILDHVEKYESHVDKDDCLDLLDYLVFLFPLPEKEIYRKRVYSFLTKVLLLQSMTDLFEITVEFLLKYNGSNVLECPKTEEIFKEFITHNAAFKSPQTVRFVLISILKNPKKIIDILLRMVIGDQKYDHIMISPSDFFLLAPILKIRTEDAKALLFNILRGCMENTEWNAKKFAHFIQVMEEYDYKADDIFNEVFIPFLDSDTFVVSSLNSVLHCMRKMESKCTENVRIDVLMRAIAKRMSYLRKDTSLPKYTNGEMLCLLTRVLQYFVQDRSSWFNAVTRKSVIAEIEPYLEPIDRLYFATMWNLTKKGIDIEEIMQDYERRCFSVMSKIKVKNISEDLRNCINNFTFMNEYFVQHLILRSTEFEYTRFATEIVILHWDIYNWTSEMNAFENFVRITIDASLLCLEFPDVGSPDSFPFLIKCLSRLSKSIFKLNVKKCYQHMYATLSSNVKRLDSSINQSQYSSLYQEFLNCIKNSTPKEPMENILQKLIDTIHHFGNQCLEVGKSEKQPEKMCTPEIIKFRMAHQFLCNVMKASAEDAYIFLTKMDEILFPDKSEEECVTA